jgi:DNA-binding response OmpR family regulator
VTEALMGRHRILVVDDEVSSAEVVALILMEEGHQVSFAVDARQALAALAQERFDLLVTDYMLPGLSGVDLARAAREQPGHEALPVVVMSGAPAAALRVHGDAFDAFLRKPFQIDQLLHTVKALLERGEA